MSGTTYYQRNRGVILNRAKDYYENNKELLRERTKNKYRELSEEEKNRERECGKSRYHNMSEEKKKRLKEYQKTYRDAKRHISQIQMSIKEHYKIAIAKIFVLLLRSDGFLIIIIKALNAWAHLAIHKAFIILSLKHHLIFQKLITRFIIINQLHYQIHYQSHYQIHYQIYQMNLDLNHH